MKAKDALIAWTPEHWGNVHPETCGKIKIGHLLSDGEPDWTDPYTHTGGAAYAAWRKLPKLKMLAMIFIEFNAITVRDGVPPKVAHEAFLRSTSTAHIAPDMTGAANPDPYGGLC